MARPARIDLRVFQQELAAKLANTTAAKVESSRLGLSCAGERWLIRLADAAEVVAVPQLGFGGKTTPIRRIEGRPIRQHRDAGTEPPALLGQQLPLGMGGNADDFDALRQRGGDIQRAGADGPGATENGDAAAGTGGR